MTIRPVKDKEEIKKILFDDAVFELAKGQANITKEQFKIPLDGVFYLGGYHNGEIFGLSCMTPFLRGFKFHPYILEKHKKSKARLFVGDCLNMINYTKYVEIDKNNTKLINFAKKFGFKGIDNLSKDRILMRLS